MVERCDIKKLSEKTVEKNIQTGEVVKTDNLVENSEFYRKYLTRDQNTTFLKSKTIVLETILLI